MPHLPSLSIFTLLLFICLTSSCAVKGTGDQNTSKHLQKWSEKAIFTFLHQCDPYKELRAGSVWGQMVGKGLVKIDPVLIRRGQLIHHGKVYFDLSMQTDSLKKPLSKARYQLAIPDSLRHKYALIDPTEDYEHDYSIIHQFSPLLPTERPGTFLMEHFMWYNECSALSLGKRCVRGLIREYLEFKIIDGAIFCQNASAPTLKTETIGFGVFERKSMNNALLGEKMPNFGYERWHSLTAPPPKQ